MLKLQPEIHDPRCAVDPLQQEVRLRGLERYLQVHREPQLQELRAVSVAAVLQNLKDGFEHQTLIYWLV